MKPKINQLINKSVVQLKRGSPTVLTCLGVAGVIATTVSAVMATPKAIEKIRKDSLINHDGDPCGWNSLDFDEHDPDENRLFYDEYSRRYFESSVSRVLQAEYHLNRNFVMSGHLSSK